VAGENQEGRSATATGRRDPVVLIGLRSILPPGFSRHDRSSPSHWWKQHPRGNCRLNAKKNPDFSETSSDV